MDEVMEKLTEHDAQFVVLNKKLIEHDAQFEAMNKRLDDHDCQLDIIARTVVDHTERLDRIEQNMMTKSDFSKVMKTFDEIAGYYRKKDEEITFMARDVKRHNDNFDKLKKVLPAVGLV
ncbi:MAG: hypothetical protein A3J93_04925 [Candidatus Magasanikbacteria bacterium RIFOXYC2_FULL_42_28]|uniref:Uncharacterized protein n=1 Tax=Candidatus Magasanikbacteria bacterium RIFOXYC2_FULL_42_28 TaxID=1798704 RepID=A0A1F6NWQ2_9BACT|nr:MAG: hypothetical protein A3J93_04925 [Candidatus Magasanikbacteria bacterium RIFOXYC2_FULL_42_28]